MWQKVSLILALLLLVASFGWAQTPGLETQGQGETYQPAPAPEEAAPAAVASSNEATGESVVELAEFISTYVGDSGQLPDLVQVKTGTGNLRVLSVAEAFILVARTVDLWRTDSDLPAAVPIAPADVSRPDIDPEDVPQGKVDVSVGQEIPTEAFLDQAHATVRWVDQLRKVPTAVWVQGVRLSAAQYTAGLAICLQYAYSEGGLLDTIFMPAYAPPETWAANLRVAQANTEEAQQGDEQASAEQAGEGGEGEGSAPESTEGQAPGESAGAVSSGAGPVGSLRPMTPTAIEEAPASATETRPRLEIFPPPGEEVSGIVELVASYSGPPAQFVIFSIDGATRAIMNIPPYSFRWDASALAPGTHTVRVQALGDGNAVLTDLVSAYDVTEPKSKAPAEEQPEEF
jgi:hypothetical protein